jgi:MoaA/NifB/PqqE/SkfB family radical SAM enzyme
MKELIIELTNRCLNDCIHCSSKNCGADGVVHDVSISEIEPVVNSALQAGYSRVVFSGGEPMLHPEFCNIVEYFSVRNVGIKMYTSGVASDDVYERKDYVEALSKIDTITVSCYSNSEIGHNTIVRNSNGYSYFRKFLDVFSSIAHHLEMNIVPMSHNVHEVNSVYESYKDILASYNVLKLVKQGNAAIHWESICVNEAVLNDELTMLKSKPHTKIGNSFGALSNSVYQCEAGRTKMCITFDGYVIPCEVFKSSRKQFKHCSAYASEESTFLMDAYHYSQHDYSRGCQARTICL